ncbi:hypothetical protein CsatB_017730 [Cannabis sativa]
MEPLSAKSAAGGAFVVKQEINRVESHGDQNLQYHASKIGRNERPLDENDDTQRSPKQDLSSEKQQKVPRTTTDHVERSSTSIEPNSMAAPITSIIQNKEQDDQLESSKAELGEIKEENQRLKIYLSQIMKDYQTLQMQFNKLDQEAANKKKKSTDNNNHENNLEAEIEESDLISLSLGSFSNNNPTKINNFMVKEEKNKNISKVIAGDDEEGLSLGLEYNKYHHHDQQGSKSSAGTGGEPAVSNPSAASSFDEQLMVNKEEAGETWPPSKVLKTTAVKRSVVEDEVSQQNPAKKTRVCVRVRCDTPTMNDGCQWRKYGQKIAKGNPCPRAYYRCTVAPSCPVRKQVQRCADDMSILITTYEGTHNHPLPVSATAMASTTSAAASMLLSGSTTSSNSGNHPSSATTSATAELHRFTTLDSSKWNLINNKQTTFYLPNSSSTTSYSSYSSSHPTITLDLTSSNSSPLLNKFSTTTTQSPNYPHHHHTLYPSSSLSFGPPSNNNINSSDQYSNSNLSWINNNGFLNYGSSSQVLPYNTRNQSLGTLATLANKQNPSGTTTHPTTSSTHQVQNYKNSPTVAPTDQSSTTIAAATQAITADPAFQSALAAALTSIIGGARGGGDNNNNNNNVDLGQKLTWGSGTSCTDHYPRNQQQHLQSSSSLPKGINGGNLTFLSPNNSMSFSSASKSSTTATTASASPHSDHHTTDQTS